ncbi:hypothetical protein ASE01_01910 [Nocardioides sp. Root190]|uniref:hypothetical protein n=1 Tax=Nocardioides sp. Root190 TaxID=1736488 RepID=UPI0006FA8741|nr:hypothetical protein [Nocardioides sp. Root190]KRB80270.1 hypothetical protein ASE01_01910 [Nocardioides sp. Root190]
MSSFVRSRSTRVGIAVGVLVVLALLLLSHSFGRAVPTNNYRPLLSPAALDNGCFPLPGDASLDGLAHQVRWDGDVETSSGPRRELRGQYDLVGRDEATERIVAAFVAVGFREVSREDDGDTLVIELADGDARVGLQTADLPGTDQETLVRGTFVLDLPVVAATSDDPLCSDPKSTKRFAPGQEPTR